MVIEAILVFTLQNPFVHSPKFKVYTEGVIEIDYSRKGVSTSWDEPAAYVRDHPSVYDWLDRWAEEIHKAKQRQNAITR
jgi:hypothetical protein